MSRSGRSKANSTAVNSAGTPGLCLRADEAELDSESFAVMLYHRGEIHRKLAGQTKDANEAESHRKKADDDIARAKGLGFDAKQDEALERAWPVSVGSERVGSLFRATTFVSRLTVAEKDSRPLAPTSPRLLLRNFQRHAFELLGQLRQSVVVHCGAFVAGADLEARVVSRPDCGPRPWRYRAPHRRGRAASAGCRHRPPRRRRR